MKFYQIRVEIYPIGSEIVGAFEECEFWDFSPTPDELEGEVVLMLTNWRCQHGIWEEGLQVLVAGGSEGIYPEIGSTEAIQLKAFLDELIVAQ